MRSRNRSGSRAKERAKERANMSFFIFVMFFAVFGIIMITEFLILEKHSGPNAIRTRYDDLQDWENKAQNEAIDQPAQAPTVPLDAVWQPVSGTRYRFYVYSAYVERRTVAAVRIIGATKTRGPDAVFCRLWLPDNRTLTLKAKIQTIRENWNLKYSAVYVLCLLRTSGVQPKETIGATVAVLSSADAYSQPTNLLIVQDTEPKPGIEETLHVCVKPFHFHYGRGDWMVEWMELHRLLGVSHFYMYNKSMSEQTTCLINHYKKDYGLITLLPWNLPITSGSEIRTEGQFAAFNDCLYRSMSSAGWLLVVDVDEVLLPRHANTLTEMISKLSASYAPKKVPAAFLYRNAFFYMLWEDDLEAPANLITACKTRRWAVPHVLKNRSKFTVRPSDTVELGNHFTWELLPGATSVGVPKELALLHHYRENCEFGGVQCVKVPSAVDRTAHKWSAELMRRVTAENKLLAQACPKNFPV